MTDPIYGDVISRYTRAQAIEDGLLFEVTDAPEAAALFKYPAAITVGLRAALQKGQGRILDTYNARLFDVFYMSILASQLQKEETADLFYKCRVGGRSLKLWANCGPDDSGAPCMTFGFPEDR